MSLTLQFFLILAFVTISYCSEASFRIFSEHDKHSHDEEDDDDSSNFIGFHDSLEMPIKCSDMTASLVQSDYFSDSLGSRFYLVGGCTADQACIKNNDGSMSCACPTISDACHVYTPAFPNWSACSSAPNKRYRHMASVVGSKIYLFGGRDLADNLITAIDVYDVTTNSWSNPYNWSNPTSDAGAVTYNSKIYLVGGYDAMYTNLATLMSFDPFTGNWDYNLPSMAYGRGDIAVQLYLDNTILVIGGWVDNCNSSRIVEQYTFTPSGGSWEVLPSLIYGRGDLAVGVMGEHVFAIAGETKAPSDPTCSLSVPIPWVTRFEEGQSHWEVEADIPMNLFRFIGGSYNGSTEEFSRAIYLFGGQKTYDDSCSCYPVVNSTIKYIPASTYTKKSKAAVLSPGGIAGIVLGGLIFLGMVLVGLGAYLAYRRRGFYTKHDIALSQRQFVIEGDEEPVTELAKFNKFDKLATNDNVDNVI